MSTDTFRRHTRARVDAATHRAFASLPTRSRRRELFERLLLVARRRSTQQVQALRNFVDFAHERVRDPESWTGASGHPLCVVDSLASHLFGRYATPRFLASAWFGDRTSAAIVRRRWFIAHARGQRFRSLDLPFGMTRQMEHVFLRTPDHVDIDRALRRAEVLGLGGTLELVDAILATRLAEQFDDWERWRVALAWLVRCGDAVDLGQVSPLVDYLHANLRAIDLRGRSFASVMRLVDAWHARLAQVRSPFLRWRRAGWNGLTIEAASGELRRAEWTIVELLDSRALVDEGRRLRHCVSTYAQRCASGRSSIWSLRHRWCDDDATRSLLTIEVRPDTKRIVQIRTYANGQPARWQLELVRAWAEREGLSGATA